MTDDFVRFGVDNMPDEIPADTCARLESATMMFRQLLPEVRRLCGSNLAMSAVIVGGHVSASLDGICTQEDVDIMVDFLRKMATQIETGEAVKPRPVAN